MDTSYCIPTCDTSRISVIGINRSCLWLLSLPLHLSFFFFFNDTATTEIYTLSLHDALPIWDQYCGEAVERPRSDCGLQRSGPGGRGLSVPQRPVVLCLVVICEKTLSASRAVDGDDLGAVGLFGGATSGAQAISAAKRDRTEPNSPTDSTTDLALALPTARRDSPRPRHRPRQGSRCHRRPE